VEPALIGLRTTGLGEGARKATLQDVMLLETCPSHHLIARYTETGNTVLRIRLRRKRCPGGPHATWMRIAEPTVPLHNAAHFGLHKVSIESRSTYN